ncbi:3834_t:CDS:2, partial [Scutellospora calospora]
MQNLRAGFGSAIVGSVNFGFNRRQGTNESSEKSTADTYTRVYGGDKNKFSRDNIDSWRDSLNDYTKWCAIEYYDLIPIFDILDPELRKEVIKQIIGPKILHSAKDPVEFSMLPPKNSPFIHILKIPPDFNNNLMECKLFASVMSLENQDDVFSIRVIYTSDSTASLVLHRIGESKKVKKFKLQLGWIIIGYPKSFKHKNFNFCVTNSCEKCIQNYENIIDIYENFNEVQNCSLLATCAQRIPQQDRENPIISDLLHRNQFDRLLRNSDSCIRYNTPKLQGAPLWTCKEPTFVNFLHNACPANCIAG